MHKKIGEYAAIRVIVPVGITVCLFVGAILVLFIPALKFQLMEEKRTGILQMVDSAWSILEAHEKKVKKGEISRKEAQKIASELIRCMRYGPEQKDYFWINDMSPIMIMHPYRADLEGTDLSEFTDPNGKHLFLAFVEKVKADGAGYVNYMWQWKDDPSRIVPKLSYVREFESWGWIIGTGIYLEDVDARIALVTRKLIIVFGLILCLVVSLSGYVVVQGIRTSKRRAYLEEERIRSEKRLSDIIDFLPEATFVVNEDRKVIAWNRAMEQITGTFAADMIGKGQGEYAVPFYGKEKELLIDYVFRPEKKQNIEKDYMRFERTGDKVMGEAFIQGANGNDRFIHGIASPLYDEAGSIVGAIESIRDVTDKMKMQESLVQSEKMLSVGGLAAGMAHEINNPLAGILQNTQVISNRLCKRLEANAQIAEECGTSLDAIMEYLERRNIFSLLQNVTISGNKATKIVQNMLGFARKSSEGKKKQCDIRELLDETLVLVSSEFDLHSKYDFRKINIIREYSSDVLSIGCESSEIEQVFLNILQNGAQAMVEANIGDPTFVLRVYEETEYVYVEIEDNGPGISEENRKRVFEPFFTTKGVGHGTGLGLSISFFIITQNHGGTLSVESPPGKGARFIIRLPKTLES